MVKGDRAAVAVVGGGIGGIQASLELANSGFQVYLIEKDISIGGRMAQLDKTFPTNDCSTCMISPRFLEVASHPNITILTLSEVVSLRGEPGNFTIRVVSKPRFIDPSLCTACGECVKVCPVEVSDSFNQGLSIRKAAYKHFPQAVPSAFAIDKVGTAPCKAACPAGISIEGFIALIRKGSYDEALKLIKRDNPLPAVCGRVCPHPCEIACYRGRLDDPLAIEKLKRFVADRDLFSNSPYIPEKKPLRDKSVAIIGAGPAGLTVAYYLAIEGFEVVVFEAMDKPGGLLQYGIPYFRLERNVVEREIEVIKQLGVIFKTGQVWGRDFTLAGLRKEFDAVFIGVGAQKPIPLSIPGEDLKGVYAGVEFLEKVCKGASLEIGRNVAVIGGGSVAVDVALTAKRLGAEQVTILYRRSRKEMPVVWEDLEEVEEENINIEYLTGVVEILGDAEEKVRGLKCIKMRLGTPDESGRRRPVPIEGSYFEIEADMVFSAIGQEAHFPMLETEPPETQLKLGRWNTIWVDPKTYETSVSGVFAAGDAVLGPSTVVLSIGSAKEAAVSIVRYLEGREMTAGRDYLLPVPDEPFKLKPKKKRVGYRKIALEERLKSFNEIFLGFSEEEAREEASRCLECGGCSECYRCEDVCAPNAVKHRMEPEERELNVVGLVLAPGFEPFDPRHKQEYGYKRYSNVVTSLEFERLLSASGPTGGEILCPGDGHHPKKIAWIQCVGSRDVSIGREYCSGVCCMYATKQAMVAKDHDPEVEATIFFIDFRALGKGFDKYYERAKKQYNIRYIKSSISRVVEKPNSKKIEVFYVNEKNETQTETFDLVVLSVGLRPSSETSNLARLLGLETDKYGFIKTDPFDPVQTNIKGIVVCGVAQEPKDIPESVIQACSASSSIQVLRGVWSSDGTQDPGEGDSTGKPKNTSCAEYQDPRVGVFVCHCGINIAGVVDVKAVARYAKNLPQVLVAESLLFACASDGTKRIKEAIKEYRLNRIVVASCSPRTHEPLFRQTIREAGINKYLFEMANIRDQCSWVHGDNPSMATEKAKNLVKMAVAKAMLLKPIEEIKSPIIQRALVVGGGPSGMVAALQLAVQGYPVTLVEKESCLGGNAAKWSYIHYSGASTKEYIEGLIARVKENKNIDILLNAEVIGFEGKPGAFRVKVDTEDGKRTSVVEVGSIVVATGAREYGGDDFFRGRHERVMTQKEFQKGLALLKESFHASSRQMELIKTSKNVVMIQCVGSRNEMNPYCSRICCTVAVANALTFKKFNPDARVTILYRDVRTYGTKELLYYEARTRGVRFLRYDLDNPPHLVEPDEQSGLMLNYYDPVLDKNFLIPADLLVLSTGIIPPETNRNLSKILKLNLDADGFFLESHIKLKPLDTATTGIFICGLAQGPKFLEECLDQAKGAASRAASFLGQKYLVVGGTVASVRPEACSRCLTCVRVCPYGAPTIGSDKGAAAFIDPALCQGCGACVVSCPGKAIDLGSFTDSQLMAKIQAWFV